MKQLAAALPANYWPCCLQSPLLAIYALHKASSVGLPSGIHQHASCHGSKSLGSRASCAMHSILAASLCMLDSHNAHKAKLSADLSIGPCQTEPVLGGRWQHAMCWD